MDIYEKISAAGKDEIPRAAAAAHELPLLRNSYFVIRQ